MRFGTLTFSPITDNLELLAPPIQLKLQHDAFKNGVFVSPIDPELADTALFCEAYEINPECGANCIIIEAKRADKKWYAACLLLASDRLDVNGKVRQFLDAKKTSFAPRDMALNLTGMEFGGITPLALPNDMPILVDENVLNQKYLIIGSGIRNSKILIQSNVLAELANVKVLDIIKE